MARLPSSKVNTLMHPMQDLLGRSTVFERGPCDHLDLLMQIAPWILLDYSSPASHITELLEEQVLVFCSLDVLRIRLPPLLRVTSYEFTMKMLLSCDRLLHIELQRAGILKYYSLLAA